MYLGLGSTKFFKIFVLGSIYVITLAVGIFIKISIHIIFG